MQRKKSPRAPSMSLEDSINRVKAIYDKERLQTVSLDVAAIDMGYKDAKSGASKQAIGALKAFGLLISPKPSHVSVDATVQTYNFTPDKNAKQKIIREWLESPTIYLAIISKYQQHLPSPAQLKFDLIDMGFSPKGADECLENFIKSVEFADYYSEQPVTENIDISSETEIYTGDETRSESFQKVKTETVLSQNVDRIPIRLVGGRRAWLEIPMPFYEKDKEVIKNQIELIITDEEENE